MQVDEARILLGFPPNSRPTQFQVKSAYKKKVWESHPDRFPVHEKCHAESQFKLSWNEPHFANYICCRFQKLILACVLVQEQEVQPLLHTHKL
ncbi:uncharacterized protein LOC131156345 isoform X3 [Malania oleifera]|uniref:uncharacterized protein LOC131156345 isoform X3 n=1 Tax=Malania oleifera TaxID=397392 RepID=UPI0025ADA485|nr:uncharacterized protein LOC131156345 isoform X3 [Malania oleifera]